MRVVWSFPADRRAGRESRIDERLLTFPGFLIGRGDRRE